MPVTQTPVRAQPGHLAASPRYLHPTTASTHTHKPSNTHLSPSYSFASFSLSLLFSLPHPTKGGNSRSPAVCVCVSACLQLRAKKVWLFACTLTVCDALQHGTTALHLAVRRLCVCECACARVRGRFTSNSSSEIFFLNKPVLSLLPSRI